MTAAVAWQEIIAGWGYYLFHATWQASLVALAMTVLVMLCKFLPSNVRYGALLIALLKFALPCLPALMAGVVNLTHNLVAPFSRQNAAFFAQRGSALNSGLLFLCTVHLFGMLVTAASLYRQHRRLNQIRREGIELLSGELYKSFVNLAREMGFRQPPLLIASCATTVPFAFGLRTQVLVVPQVSVSALSLEQLRPVLAHELAHLRHRDQWVNWVQAVLGVVWWFNPFYHLLSRFLREVREECCDDAVLAAGLASSQAYSSSLLAVAALARTQSQAHLALHSLGTQLHPLAVRLVRIADPTVVRTTRFSLPQLGTLLLLALLVLPGLHLDGRSATATQTAARRPLPFVFPHPHAHRAHQETHRRAHPQH